MYSRDAKLYKNPKEKGFVERKEGNTGAGDKDTEH